MIIDAKEMSHPKHRPYTTLGAVAFAIDKIDVGQTLKVDYVRDATGDLVSMPTFSVCVNKTKADRVFKVRSAKCGAFANVTRIA
jgi:hypothetical protein